MDDADIFRWAIEAQELAVIIDSLGIIRHVGPTYAGILGSVPSEIIGKPVLDFVPHTGLLNVLQTGEPEFGKVFVLKNNQPVVVNRYPIKDSGGRIKGALSIAGFPDLSQFKALSDKISSLMEENISYKKKLAELENAIILGNVVGQSEKIEKVKELAQKVADSDITVLLSGETGTGKEVFANYVKQLSSRRDESFVKINCAAIPNELLESELFGFSEGSFSGAKKGGKKGKFEIADKGTILLDEIGELPLDLQAKLLRVLQEKEIDSIGSLKPKKINVRVICCTNQNLGELVRKKLFREDLYYRINIVEIEIPPLRERLDDIPLLCSYLIKKINGKNKTLVQGIADEAIALFYLYDWPGNIRELEHTLERACIMSAASAAGAAGTLTEKDFDFFLAKLKKNAPALQAAFNTPYAPLSEKKRDLERKELAEALLKTGGNKSKAAKLLNMPRSVFYDKIKLYNIDLNHDKL
ncbi:MAG: sigma 54-interacting transcriptional regulator [Spirochaetes bacterium]|nr:sigma 54-interacting transcriptional regulator [Spirochaetota bacterium]